MKLLKTILAGLLVLSLVPLAAGVEKSIDLKIPVRFANPDKFSPDLNGEAFQLTINNKLREVAELTLKERSIGKTGGLGRNFILSFHMTEYGTLMEKGVEYFISEILDPADAILLVSPLKIYQINVSANKEHVIREIGNILKQDCKDYRKKRVSKVKSLKNKIRRVKEALSDTTDSSVYGVQQILTAKKFIDTFPQEFLNFINLSLIMNTEKYETIIELLGLREGERYWIHFHQDELSNLLTYIKSFVKDFNQYINTWESQETRRMADLEKTLAIAGSFPVKKLSRTLVTNGISYNLITFAGAKTSEGSSTRVAGFTRKLEEMAEKSGGVTIRTADPGRAIRQLSTHNDRYYQLSFTYNGIIEEKSIILSLKNNKNKLLYRPNYTPDELSALIHYLTEEKVQITDLKSVGPKLKFTIKSFKHHKKGKFGILNVSIQLMNQSDSPIYKTENTLRSSQEQITLTIPIPRSIKGNATVQVTIRDLLANRKISQEIQVDFK